MSPKYLTMSLNIWTSNIYSSYIYIFLDIYKHRQSFVMVTLHGQLDQVWNYREGTFLDLPVFLGVERKREYSLQI